MEGMKQELERRYHNLFADYGLASPMDTGDIIPIIRRSLSAFLRDAKRPAIYCNGGHTKMLMAGFMYELRNVKHIVDNYAPCAQEGGFALIRDDEIEAQGIDAIVLSSYKFRNDLKESLKKKHPHIPVLDIYDEFAKAGILVETDYYYFSHPYQHYKRINDFQRQIREGAKERTLKDLYLDLVTRYLHIKDFRTAIIKLNEWAALDGAAAEDITLAERMRTDVEFLYELERKAAAQVSGDHVLMFCMDGLRQQDLSVEDMPKLKKMLDETSYQFTRAYSYSTSTYESLVAVYSGNSDFRTRDFEKNHVEAEDCSFASLALQQGRQIHIYADNARFLEGEGVRHKERFLTVTQKLWQFILDALETERELFYIHELYESHFTFSNPYTEEKLMSEGTAMLFDFLPAKGGRLRADYDRQHRDAIHYLDDVVTPLLRPLKCRMAIYADHGNLVLGYDSKLTDVGALEYTCSEGWTRIPLALRAPEMAAGTDNRLISLMELNKMMESLLTAKSYAAKDVGYIKIGRSQLYNPNFQVLYEMVGKGRQLLAFECFLFVDGRRLIVYADGAVELYDTAGNLIQDGKVQLAAQIEEDITVCDSRSLQL